jgi:hypothetical protein
VRSERSPGSAVTVARQATEAAARKPPKPSWEAPETQLVIHTLSWAFIDEGG